VEIGVQNILSTGHRVRVRAGEALQAYGVNYILPFEEMAERISAYRERGIRIFSTKPGGDADGDIRLYSRIAAQRLDGETYIADSNRSWSVPTAIRVARNLEQYGFFNLVRLP
jgi:L-alanine-DL-glutamate epimerase-like enolase superfamily enzyme